MNVANSLLTNLYILIFSYSFVWVVKIIYKPYIEMVRFDKKKGSTLSRDIL